LRPSRWKRGCFGWPPLCRTISILTFCTAAAAAQAQTNKQTNALSKAQTTAKAKTQAEAKTNTPPNDPLVDLLVKKGFVTLEEAQKLRSESDSLKTNNDASFSKWKISDGIKSVELYGDVRMRYETRDVRTPVSSKLDLDRFRYALRLGLRGDLAGGFYYGLRLETASNPRSPWVTLGTSTSGSPYQGPFGKSTSGIDVGQIYLGWRPNSNIDIALGKLSNPLYTTPMVWDTDINPEGAAEHFKYAIGPAEFFATFSQFLYQDDNPSESTLGLLGPNDTGHVGNTLFMMAWQGGVKYQLSKNISFKGAGTLYNYISHGTNNLGSPPGPSPGTPGFSDTYVGEGYGIPVIGASGYGNPASTADGFYYNQTGVNNLLVLEFPFEVNFKLLKHQARVFGDFAENLDGAARAEAAVAAAANPNIYFNTLNIPLQRNQYHAYQFGLAVGNGDDLGLVYGSAPKKGAWEARFYWQHVEQYALDPNLLDSDFFEGRGNMQGFYTAFSYGFTGAMIGTVRYGYASRIDKELGTGGSNQDVPQVNPIDQYNLLQLDLTMKF
jgi:hypothetical protein